MSDWKRMGAAVRARREALGLTQEEAAVRASVGVTTWRQVELGNQDRYRGLTLAAVSRALDWPPDACSRIAEGEDPSIAAFDDRASMPSVASEDPPTGVPAALSGVWSELTEEERQRVLAYVQGLRDARRGQGEGAP